MGHIKAAEAIKEQLEAENPNTSVEIIDFIDYMFPALSKGIYKTFNFMVSRCSGLYNAINKAAGKNSGVPMKLTFTRRIDKLIKEHHADAIVVAFPVCSQYISSYKRMLQMSDSSLYIHHRYYSSRGVDCAGYRQILCRGRVDKERFAFKRSQRG